MQRFLTSFNTLDTSYEGPTFLALWRDLLGLGELRGHVFAIGSAFVDFVIEAKADFMIISPNYLIQKSNPV